MKTVWKILLTLHLLFVSPAQMSRIFPPVPEQRKLPAPLQSKLKSEDGTGYKEILEVYVSTEASRGAGGGYEIEEKLASPNKEAEKEIKNFNGGGGSMGSFDVLALPSGIRKAPKTPHASRSPPNFSNHAWTPGKPEEKPFPLLQISYVIFLVVMIFVFPALFEQLEDSHIKIVSLKDLVSLPRKEFVSIKTSERKYEECPICFERFLPISAVRILHCSHYFHSECVDPWLLSRSCRCPVCNCELSFT